MVMYSKEIRRKIKSVIPFLSYRHVDFLLNCFYFLPSILGVVMLYFLITTLSSPQVDDLWNTRHRNSIIESSAWIRDNEGKTFMGYSPVTYERDIKLKGDDPVKEIITGCSVSEGVDHAKLVYIKGIYPSKQEALDSLHKTSTGSQVTVYVDTDGERIYRVREDMLEVGIFCVDGSYIPYHDAKRIEVLGHEEFQDGVVESGVY